MPAMSMKERMLAVIRGEKPDRVPFVQYSGLAAPDEEVWSVIGRENMGLLKWVAPHGVRHPNCSVESEDFEQNGRRGIRTTITTSKGRLVEEKLVEPAYGSAHITRHFVRKPDD